MLIEEMGQGLCLSDDIIHDKSGEYENSHNKF
jgi:hypothetical protein